MCEGKYGQERTVPVLPYGRPVISRYLSMRAEMVSKHMPTNDALFPAMGDRGDGVFSGGKMLSLKNIVEAETGVSLDFRACRRTFGQTCVDSGVDLDSVSILLGHTTTKTTETYYCRKREDVALKEVFEVFEPKKTPSAIKPLIENEKYLSGYAQVCGRRAATPELARLPFSDFNQRGKPSLAEIRDSSSPI